MCFLTLNPSDIIFLTYKSKFKSNVLERITEELKECIKSVICQETESGRMPESIFVLSGGIIRKDDEYKSPSYSETDDHGLITGGKARSIAAAKISEIFPDINFVTTSRRLKEEPTHASVVAAEMERFGAKQENIILEENSWDTYSEMIEMIKMAQREGWSRVAIVTNDYHVPRAKEFFIQLEKLSEQDKETMESISKFKQQVEVSFIPAEKILESTSGHYKNLISKVRESDNYKDRLAAEQRGIEALRSGDYQLGKDPYQ